MKIRWKFLIVLLCVSLIPMIVMRWNGQRALREMGNDLAAGAGTELVENTKASLKRLVEDHARVLKRERELIEMTLLLISAEIHKRVFDRNSPGPFLDASFYLRTRGALLNDAAGYPETVDSSEYCVLMHSGKCPSLDVDFSRIKTTATAGSKDIDLATTLADRFATMAPLFRSLKTRYPEIIFWIHTRMECGVQTIFPYFEAHHGRRMFLKRNLSPDWYESAKEKDTIIWSNPSPDFFTGKYVYQVSIPLRGPSGNFLGAVSISVPLAVFLHENEHIKRLSDEVTSLIVKAGPSSGNSIRIMAREDEIQRERMRWYGEEEKVYLETPDKIGLQKISENLMNRQSGVSEILFKGVLNLAAYQGFDEYGDTLLLLIPKKDILADAVAMENYVRERIDDQIEFTRIILSSIALITVLLSYVLSRSFTRNISRIAEAVARVAAGDFSQRISSKSRDELGELAEKFNAMIPALEEHVQMRNALNLAKEVQQNLLPSSLPELESLDISAESIYCKETGGDFYDFIKVFREGIPKTAVAVGDVTGHGISAALLMAASRAFLRARISLPGGISEMISDVNKLLSRDTRKTSQFVTLFYLEIDLKQNAFNWIRAGHDPAIIYDPAKDVFLELQNGGPALGVLEDFRFEEPDSHTFSPGQVLFIGTDGIWETRNSEGEMFGKENLKSVIRNHAEKSAKEILKSVISAISNFRKTQAQDDDVTLIVIKVNEKSSD